MDEVDTGSGDGSASGTVGEPPRAIMAAVAIIGVLLVNDVARIVLFGGLEPWSASVEDIVVTLVWVVLWLLVVRWLWRGRSVGRIVTIVFTVLGLMGSVLSAVGNGVGPVDPFLAWAVVELLLAVALLVLMFVGEVKTWCRADRTRS